MLAWYGDPDFNATAGARRKFRRLRLDVSDLAIKLDRSVKAPQRDFAHIPSRSVTVPVPRGLSTVPSPEKLKSTEPAKG